MMAAIGLNFVSQFLLYWNDTGQNASTYSAADYIFGPTGTGWQMHGLAAWIPVGLAVVYFIDRIYLSPLFRQIGWWITVVLLIVCTIDGQPFFEGATGAKLGWLSVLVAIVAAWMNLQAQRQPAAPPSTPPIPSPPTGPASASSKKNP